MLWQYELFDPMDIISVVFSDPLLFIFDPPLLFSDPPFDTEIVCFSVFGRFL